jgi:hypothetical protein
MSRFDFDPFPSPALRAHHGAEVARRIAPVKADLHVTLLDGLGDLALALARRPLRRWSGTMEALADLLRPARPRPEATAIVEIAERQALLVRAMTADGALRPASLGQFVWLGARRIALTGDATGLMDRRLHGLLFDMFAMAPSFVTDADEAQGLVRLMAERPGPYDDLLELADTLAASAVAWGAAVDEPLRNYLIERAIGWTEPSAMGWKTLAGAALLTTHARDARWGTDLVNLSLERLDALLNVAAETPESLASEALLGAVDGHLAVIVAGLGVSEETLDALVPRLPPTVAHRAARAVSRVTPPGPRRDALLMHAARLALGAGDTAALGTLDGLAHPEAPVIGPVHDAFQRVIERPQGDAAILETALGACRAIGHWETCTELTLHLLGRVALAPTRLDLRVAAAAALSGHRAALGDQIGLMLETLEARMMSEDAETGAGACAAAMHLGSGHPRLTSMAVARVADGAPWEPLGDALDDLLRHAPEQSAGIAQFLAQHAGDARVTAAAVALLSQVAAMAHREWELGPFFLMPPLGREVRYELARVLLPVVSQADHPALAVDAAAAVAWLLRGDASLAPALLNLRAFAAEPAHRATLDLALGALGVLSPAVITRLGEDVALGPPELSAAAAVAIRVAVDTYADARHFEPWLATIRARADLEGPQQAPVRELLQQLATLPLDAADAAH